LTGGGQVLGTPVHRRRRAPRRQRPARSAGGAGTV